jgi:hypothetical protein
LDFVGKIQTTLPPVWCAAATSDSVVDPSMLADAITMSFALFPAARADINSDASSSLSLLPYKQIAPKIRKK